MRVGELLRQVEAQRPRNAWADDVKMMWLEDIERAIAHMAGADYEGHILASDGSGTGVACADTEHIKLPWEMDVRDGGTVTISGASVAANNVTAEVLAWETEDGETSITVPSGTFTAMPAESGVVSVVYDGRNEPTLAEGYDRMYRMWMIAMMDFADNEMQRYANTYNEYELEMRKFRAAWATANVDSHAN